MMRRSALVLVAVTAALRAAPPKPVQPSHYAEAIGRRAALLGREDGTFEAWVYPVKVLRDFRLSVYFDGSLEPVPLADPSPCSRYTGHRNRNTMYTS